MVMNLDALRDEIEIPDLIFERALSLDEDGNLQSYWPALWPVPRLARMLVRDGPVFFSAAFQNDPSGLEGNSLKAAWLHPYLPEQLITLRETLGVARGTVHCGIDPSIGGDDKKSDYFAMATIEKLGIQGFATDYEFDIIPVDEQATRIEAYLDRSRPDLTIIEETAKNGYVFTAMTKTLNNNQGSKWLIESRQPQGARDKGGKAIRLQSMGAKFAGRLLFLPGVIEDGEIIIDPRWHEFVMQWRSFPSGHDDVLDAMYWAQYDLFEETVAAGSCGSFRCSGSQA